MDRFTAYLKGQLKEIVDAYHPGILWFDGEWEAAWTHERGEDLYHYLRQLDSNDATLHGTTQKIENDHIGWWIHENDSISWQATLPEGEYRISIDGSCASGGSAIKLKTATTEVPISIPVTGSWEKFSQIDAGTLKISTQGHQELSLHAVSRKGEGFLNLRSITLTPMTEVSGK